MMWSALYKSSSRDVKLSSETNSLNGNTRADEGIQMAQEHMQKISDSIDDLISTAKVLINRNKENTESSAKLR